MTKHLSIEERLEKLEQVVSINSKEVLTFEEASIFLGISKSYLYKLCMRQEIAYYKPMGKMNYFNRLELLDWLQSNRMASKEELKKGRVSC